MAATLVTSTEHPLVKKIRLVASRARRAPAELVLAEGIRVLEEATHSNHRFEAVLLSDGFGLRRAKRRCWKPGIPGRSRSGERSARCSILVGRSLTSRGARSGARAPVDADRYPGRFRIR